MGDQWKQRRELRGAIYRKDRATLLRLLDSEAPTDRLQLAGAGMLIALTDDGPRESARRLSAALRERWWPGDEELADEIDAALVGRGTARHPVPVDLGELAETIEGGLSGGAGGLLDLVTGELWPGMLLDDAYLDSSDLVDLPDVDVPAREQQRLRDAINGRGAFARFRRELDRAGEDLHDQWLAFREERMLGRARAWLAVEGYTASVS